MSAKLKQALLANKVSVKSRQAGEVMVRYITPDRKRRSLLVGGFKTMEIAPKLTDAKLLIHSNLGDLVKKGSIQIIVG